MSITRVILFKSLVVPFYKQNAGLFAFLLFIMVAAVGRANGVGLLEYHFSLIQGILTNFQFLLFVLCAWFLYAVKCSQFIVEKLGRRDYIFISLISLKRPVAVFGNLLLVQCMILLPVLLYAALVMWIGFGHHWLQHEFIIFLFFVLISVFSVLGYQILLRHPGKYRLPVFLNVFSLTKYSFYWLFLVRYIQSSRKILFLAVKTASCLMLFGLIFGQSKDRSDIQMSILFFSFGLLGHGVLVYTLRSMEEKELNFYRGMPVRLFYRFRQYALFYFLLFIPEIIIIAYSTPLYISYTHAVFFIFFGYSMLLFLNSLLFIRFFRKLDYLKIVTGLFLAIFIGMLAGILPEFCAGLLCMSVYIFFRNYYRFEYGE